MLWNEESDHVPKCTGSSEYGWLLQGHLGDRGRWKLSELQRQQSALCRERKGRAEEHTGQVNAGNSVKWAAPSEGTLKTQGMKK